MATSITTNGFKEFAEILQYVGVFLQSKITYFTLMIGGLWTHNKFIKERQNFPKANIFHNLNAVKNNPDKLFIHLEIIIDNIGNKDLIISNYVIEIKLWKVDKWEQTIKIPVINLK